MMKAYHLSVKDEDDAGGAIVFANTVKEAKKQVFRHEMLAEALAGGWLALRANRTRKYDGMENLSEAELAKEQWRDGWKFFDMDYPDPDEATDAEFIAWYKNAFGEPPR
jgi:hypothetical protein